MKKRNKRKSAPQSKRAVRTVQGQQVFFPGYAPRYGYRYGGYGGFGGYGYRGFGGYGGFGGFGGVGVGVGVTPFGPTFGVGAGIGFPVGGFGYYGGWL